MMEIKEALKLNLLRYRRIQGLNQAEIAKRAGISRVAYRNAEKGVAEPHQSTLRGLAKALDVSMLDLVADVPHLKSLRFGCQKTLNAQQKAQKEQLEIEGWQWLQAYNFLEDELDEHRPCELDRLPVDERSPEKTAEQVRTHLAPQEHAHNNDVGTLLEKAGIKVCLMPFKLPKVFGMSVGEQDGGPAILVNNDKKIPVVRQIFSAAHEFGHLLMHTDQDSGEEEVEEEQANIFASHFLMPKKEFAEEWESNTGLHWVDRILKTKRHFGVSYKTVLYRLVESKVASPGVYRQFNIGYYRLYEKHLTHAEEPEIPYDSKQEPAPLARVDFTEKRLGQLVHKSLQKGVISVSRAAEIMNISIEDMRVYFSYENNEADNN